MRQPKIISRVLGTPMEFTDADDDARWLRDTLNADQAHRTLGGGFKRILADIEDLAVAVRNGGTLALENDQERLRTVVTATHLIRRLRLLDTDTMRPVLHRAFRAGWLDGRSTLSRPNEPQSLGRDRLWELFVAASCMRSMDNVELAPEGENPDVRCIVRGLRWGIECKIIYSTNPKRQIEKLGDKVAQLQESPVERGIVAVNVSALLDHSPLLTSNGSRTRFEVDRYFKAEVDRVMDQIDTPSLQNEIRDQQTGSVRSKLAGFHFLAESATVIDGRLAIPRYSLGLLLEDPPSARDLAFHRRLLLGMR